MIVVASGVVLLVVAAVLSFIAIAGAAVRGRDDSWCEEHRRRGRQKMMHRTSH
jgi:hypothetical protein